MFSAWFRYTATANGRLTVDTAGTSFDAVLEVCQTSVPSAADCADHPIVNTGSDTSANPQVSVNVVEGLEYYVFLDGQPTAGGTGPNQFGAYELTLTLTAGPGNDDVSSATPLASSGVVRINGTNVGAADIVLGAAPPASISSEAAHGLRFNHGARHTVWYRYTPKRTRRVVVATHGPLNTDVEVFTGSLAAGYTDTKAGNDDIAPGMTSSRFAINVRKGTTYTIGVDGSKAAVYPQGGFGLTLGAVPVNDDRSHPVYLAKRHGSSAASGTVRGSTEFATRQGDETELTRLVGVDTWYTFVAPKEGKYRFTAAATHGFAALGVYSGKGVSGRKPVDFRASSTSKAVSVGVRAAAGQTFAIQVATTLGSAGAYTLRWR
jgi:hypothetical protein